MPKPYPPVASRILSAKKTAVGLFIILILISWTVFKNLSKQKIVDEQSKKLETEIKGLEQENLELTALIEYFGSQEFVEKQAREKLNLAKPGEKMIIVPNEEKEKTKKDEEKINASPKRWWKYFFQVEADRR